jgi:hypothetical protein
VSELDVRLAAALQAEAPPERDPLFRIEVLERIERARFRRQLLLSLLWIPNPYVVFGFNRIAPGAQTVTNLFSRWLT